MNQKIIVIGGRSSGRTAAITAIAAERGLSIININDKETIEALHTEGRTTIETPEIYKITERFESPTLPETRRERREANRKRKTKKLKP